MKSKAPSDPHGTGFREDHTMFANLIESASHQQDLVRKGRFFFFTLVSYALIVTCAGLASIYAYDAKVENQELEFLGLVPPIVPDQKAPEVKRATPKASANTRDRSPVTQRTMAIERVDSPTKVPDDVSANRSPIPEIPKSGVWTIGPENIDANIGGPPSDGEPGGDGITGPPVKMETTPPPATQPVKPPQPEIIHKSVVLNGEATFLPSSCLKININSSIF